MTPTSTTIQLTAKRQQLFQTVDENARTTLKTFNFDHCYWSLPSTLSASFASQTQIFEEIGLDVLDNTFDGYNSCIFAYGQTGSGKSYSMMGTQSDPGLIPRVCDSMFERIGNWEHPHEEFTVQVSYLEIYNERVRDLLSTEESKKFRIREHPQQGPYVDGLSVHPVESFEDIEKLLDIGNKSRTVAETAMNDTSSRSHAIFTITLTRKKYEPDLDLHHYRTSKLNLVDLAGSERASTSQTSGLRLKEGGNINKSLTSLGLVIKALTENAQNKKVFIPYRDSILTYLLKECLGGNSKTIMLATLSPAEQHAEESLSTLRYADSAKKIVNRAKINEDPKAKIIQDLLEEVARLKSQLAQTSTTPGTDAIKEFENEIEHLKIQLREKDNHIQNLKDAQSKLKSDDELVGTPVQTVSFENPFIDSKREASSTSTSDHSDTETVRKNSFKDLSSRPHLVNLNDDVMLSNVLIHYLDPGLTSVGSDPTCTIVLNGEFVDRSHCVIEVNDKDSVFITPALSSEADLNPLDEDIFRSLSEEARSELFQQDKVFPVLYVNGDKIQARHRLKHGARILIGRSHLFRFNHPQEAYVLRQKRISELSSHAGSHRSSSFSDASDFTPDQSQDSRRFSEMFSRADIQPDGFVSTLAENEEAAMEARKSVDAAVDGISDLSVSKRHERPQRSVSLPVDSSEAITLLEIKIPHVEYIDDDRPYHVFHLYVTLENESWHIVRRYSQFLAFHRQISRKLPPAITSIFPGYTVAESIASFMGTPAKFLDKRRRRLEMYMNAVASWWLSEWTADRRPIDLEVIQTQLPILSAMGVLDAYTGMWITLKDQEVKGDDELGRRFSGEDDTILQLPDMLCRK